MGSFEITWDDAEVARVLQRVRDTRLPPAPAGSGWTYGCDEAFLRRLQAHWADGYDWRAANALLNRYPQELVRVGDLDIHVVQVVGEVPGRPLVLTHGWPGSHYEFWDVVEPLAYPSRHGGRPEDAFDVILLTLPGFAYSGKPAAPMGQRATAALWRTLVTEHLGYDQFLAQGGDWGSIVTSWLALDHPDVVRAIHLNMLAFRTMTAPRDDAELAWAGQAGAAQGALGAYSALQMTKPQSLAWAAADNPLGQAAWIIERFHAWSDQRTRSFEEIFSLDELLTNVMLYVMTGSFTTGAWYYPGVVADGFVTLPPGTRCEVPTAVAAFSGDSLMPVPPRTWAELAYNVTRWTDPPEGGHFAAMEAPSAFVEDVRSWGNDVWPHIP